MSRQTPALAVVKRHRSSPASVSGVGGATDSRSLQAAPTFSFGGDRTRRRTRRRLLNNSAAADNDEEETYGSEYSVKSIRSAAAVLFRRRSPNRNSNHSAIPFVDAAPITDATAVSNATAALVANYGTISTDTKQKMNDNIGLSQINNKNDVLDVSVTAQPGVVADTGEPEPEKFSFRKLTHRQRLSLILLCTTAFFWSLVFACIAPFFPSEALKKGATPTEIGGIFGVFELTVMLSSPIWGRLCPIVGPRFMYLAGVFAVGFCNILYGSLQWAKPGPTFVVLCFVLRMFEGLGAACYMTASLPILAHQFKEHFSSVMGVESSCVSLGFMLGPLVGSIFYTIDGFYLPFVVLGSTGIIMSIIGIFLLPPITYQDEPEEHVGLLKVISIPIVPLVLLCNVSASAGLAFFDAMLSPHLKLKFNLSEILIGVWFLIMGVCEACTAPLVGLALDRGPWHLHAMLIGTLLAFCGYMCVGPSPLLPFLPEVIGVSVAAQIFVGLAIGFLFVPPAGQIFKACQQAGLPEHAGVHGAIGGLMTLSASFGGFFGPTIGGFLVDTISFEWASTIAAALFLFEAGLLSITILRRIISGVTSTKMINVKRTSIIEAT